MLNTTNESQVKISIIVPVYNCSEYLEKCLNSAIRQKIEPKEIICVDDGSTDGSVDILNRFCKESKDIIVLRQENRGAGAARNAGLKVAKGEFVVFLDGDDYYLDEDALDEMYQICKAKKLSACRALKNNTDGTVLERDKAIQGIINTNGNGYVIKYTDYQFDYDYTSYILERSLLNQYNIIFPEYRRYQDPPFLVKALFYSENIGLCERWLYSYRKSEIASRFNVNKIRDFLLAIKENIKFAREYNLNLLFERSVNRLDYEYFDIVNCYLSEDLELLEILIEINNLIYDRNSGKKLRLLENMLDCVKTSRNQYERELDDYVKKSEGIYIYGAGKYGKLFLNYLTSKGLTKKVISFVVTNKPSTNEIDGVPVKQLNDVSGKDFPVYIAVAGIAQKEIKSLLDDKEFADIKIIDTVFLDDRMGK